MVAIPDEYTDLFQNRAFATIVTLMADGMPHPTPVWIGYDPGTDPTEPWERADGPAVLVNTAEGRQKHVNVSRDPRVAGTILDPEDPYRYLSFQGEVGTVTKAGADAHIDALAQRYMDVASYPNRESEDADRIILRIDPQNVFTG